MYDITLAALIFAIPHVALLYYCAYVWRVEYKTLISIIVVATVITAFIAKAVAPLWWERIKAAIEAETSSNELTADSIMGALVFLASTIVSNQIIVRRYGYAGWAGVFGVTTLLNAVL
jgi:hypothetical protein